MMDSSERLFSQNDPPPFEIRRAEGRGRFVLACDHAGRRVPERLGGLGLPPSVFERHVAVDIGVAPLSEALGRALDAPTIRQAYSRLVIDCNRDPSRPDAIPERSDGVSVPGNLGLTETMRAERVAAIHRPYHDCIGALLDRRCAAGQPTVYVALHSFTPRLSDGGPRPWHAGVLHRGEPLALAMLQELGKEPDLAVGDNAPYALDERDYSVPRHSWPRRLPYLELEVRQDLIAHQDGVAVWAERLARLLPQALAACGEHG